MSDTALRLLILLISWGFAAIIVLPFVDLFSEDGDTKHEYFIKYMDFSGKHNIKKICSENKNFALQKISRMQSCKKVIGIKRIN